MEIGRHLYTAFLGLTALSCLSGRAFAAEATDIWDYAREIMKEVCGEVVATSTIAAIVTASIVLLLMNFSKSGRAVDAYNTTELGEKDCTCICVMDRFRFTKWLKNVRTAWKIYPIFADFQPDFMGGYRKRKKTLRHQGFFTFRPAKFYPSSSRPGNSCFSR